MKKANMKNERQQTRKRKLKKKTIISTFSVNIWKIFFLLINVLWTQQLLIVWEALLSSMEDIVVYGSIYLIIRLGMSHCCRCDQLCEHMKGFRIRFTVYTLSCLGGWRQKKSYKQDIKRNKKEKQLRSFIPSHYILKKLKLTSSRFYKNKLYLKMAGNMAERPKWLKNLKLLHD